MHLEKQGSTAATLNKGNAKTAGNTKKGKEPPVTKEPVTESNLRKLYDPRRGE